MLALCNKSFKGVLVTIMPSPHEGPILFTAKFGLNAQRGVIQKARALVYSQTTSIVQNWAQASRPSTDKVCSLANQGEGSLSDLLISGTVYD